MCQYPHGLWHLKESMQALSQSLEDSLNKTGAKLIYGQEVKSITLMNEQNVENIIKI